MKWFTQIYRDILEVATFLRFLLAIARLGSGLAVDLCVSILALGALGLASWHWWWEMKVNGERRMPSFAHLFGVFYHLQSYSSGFLWKVLGNLLHVVSSLSHGFVCCFVWGWFFLAVRKNGRKFNWLNSSTCLYGVVRLVWRLAIQLFSCW